jgi:two-component system phosphate regulon sensor histidine kinase PhoR
MSVHDPDVAGLAQASGELGSEAGSPSGLLAPVAFGLATAVGLVGLLELGVMATVASSDLPRETLRFALWSVGTVGGVAAGTGVWWGARGARRRSPVSAVEDTPASGQAAGDDEAGAEARRRAALQEAVLDQMGEGLLVFDAQGRLVLANAAAGRLLGIKTLPEGVPMRVLAEVPRLRTTVVEALRSGEVVERELVGPQGSAAMLVRAAPVTVGAHRGVVLALVDVSHVRRMEGRWKQFAADAAHELRTPVAAVSSNLEALEMVLGHDLGAGQRFMEGALRQSGRMVELVDKLMQLVRMEGPTVLAQDEVDLADVVHEVVDAWCSVDEATGTRIQVACDLEPVLGDRAAVAQVLQNLLGNALRYSAGPVWVRGVRDGSDVRIEVEDRGPGIPDAFKEAIFDRFVRVDDGRSREVGGTGLGLSIVRELVEAMGGTVSVEDAQPHGARVVARLPALHVPSDTPLASPRQREEAGVDEAGRPT